MKPAWRFIRYSSPIPRLHLALGSPSYILLRVGQVAMALLVTGSLGYSSWCWLESRALDGETARYEQSLARAQETNRQFIEDMKDDGLTFSKEHIAGVYRKVTFANRLYEKRAFSWTRLLRDLETAVPPRVSINSVRLNFKDSTIALKGLVLTLLDLNALVDDLEAHGAFRSVKVSNHRFQEYKERGSSRNGTASTTAAKGESGRSRRVVVFDLSVVYSPEA